MSFISDIKKELGKRIKVIQALELGTSSTGYLKSETKLRSKLLRFIILGKMRKRSKYFELQEYYEHDALTIIIDKILKLVDSGFKLRYRDIKATVISWKVVHKKGKIPKFHVEKLQVKIKKHYFRCKLRYYPYCPNCGNMAYKIKIDYNTQPVWNTCGHMIAYFNSGADIEIFCTCGTLHDINYGVISVHRNSFIESQVKYQPKIIELVKKRFERRFPPIFLPGGNHVQ